jgi:type IV pilus assembly protein PilW
MRPAPKVCRSAVSGFGMIEMMVALVLSLLVVAAALAVSQANQTIFRVNQGLSRIQEGARAAFELMSSDLRAAGGTACSSVARPSPGQTESARESALLGRPLRGTAVEFTVVSSDDTAFRGKRPPSTNLA